MAINICVVSWRCLSLCVMCRDDEDGFEVADLVEVVGEDSPGHVR